MKLSTLANNVYDLLTNAPQETWGGLVLGTDVAVKRALDPSEEMKDNEARLLVIPVVMEYNKDESQGRVRIRNLNKTPRVALILSFPFQEKDTTGLDVSSWSEVEKVMNLREEIDQYVFANMDNIESIESEPAMELMLDKRWFVSNTELTFSSYRCLS